MNVNLLFTKVRPVEEDDEPAHVAPSQKIVPRVQVVQHEVPPQQRQPAASSYTPQPPQAQQVSARPATQTVNVEGEAKVKYNFKAETHRELPCSKVWQLATFSPANPLNFVKTIVCIL